MMKSSKIIDIYKMGNIVIPIYMLKNFKKLNIVLEEFIFLMYLYNLGDNIVFDPEKFSAELNLKLEDVMEYVSKLSDKNLLKVNVFKNSKGIVEEVISLESFYDKLGLQVMEDVNTDKVNESNIFEMIEKEFGRTLGSMEYEVIRAWIENGISEELIEEALREAVLNGISNLRYMDKILYEWEKIGIKTRDDVEKNRLKHKKKHEEEANDLDMDIMEWDWFDEDE